MIGDDLPPGDIINSLILLSAVAAILIDAFSTRRNSRATDFSSYLQIQASFSEAWRRFLDAPEDRKSFEFFELLNIVEMACHLYNRRVISGATRSMLRIYLAELIRSINNDDFGRAKLAEAFGDVGSLTETRVFARKHDIALLE